MKRITLLLVMTIMTVFSYAQTTPPQTATQEEWFMNYTMNYRTEGKDTSETATEPIKVAFDGNDVYIKLLHPLSAEGTQGIWIKGTVNGETATFAKGQSLGSYGTTPLYLAGSTGKDVTDVTFSYLKDAGMLYASCYVLVNQSADAYSPFISYYPLSITKTKPEDPVTYFPVEVPAGLQTSEYLLKASSVQFNPDGSTAGQIPVSWTVKVGFDNNDVYIQGLTQMLPDTWVKGTLDNNNDATFEKGQFFGKALRNVFLMGLYFKEPSNIVFDYNATTGVFDGGSYYLLINASPTEIQPYDYLTGVTITKIQDKAAKPKAPAIVEYRPYNNTEGYGTIDINIPVESVDGDGLLSDKLSYVFYLENEQKPYTFTTTSYQNLDADVSEIPYNYSDGFDFTPAQSNPFFRTVFFYDDWKSVKKIGVQSIYRGGSETTKSDITWIDTETVGISSTMAKPFSEHFTDLQGRAISNAYKGLVLKFVRMNDGTMKAVKVIRQ